MRLLIDHGAGPSPPGPRRAPEGANETRPLQRQPNLRQSDAVTFQAGQAAAAGSSTRTAKKFPVDARPRPAQAAPAARGRDKVYLLLALHLPCTHDESAARAHEPQSSWMPMTKCKSAQPLLWLPPWSRAKGTSQGKNAAGKSSTQISISMEHSWCFMQKMLMGQPSPCQEHLPTMPTVRIAVGPRVP